MKIERISWHAVQLKEEQFGAMRTFAQETLGLPILVEMPGFVLFTTPNGDFFELYGPEVVPSYQFHPADVVFGFRVDDIEKASEEIKASGMELLGEIIRMETGYAYRHFRGPDGRVYGLNEDPNHP